MKKILMLSISFLLFAACEKATDLPIPESDNQNQSTPIKEDITQEEFVSVNLAFDWSKAPFNIRKLNFKFAGDISYGVYERNLFDIAIPQSNQPTPLVIYMHGGGFTRGDKESIYRQTDLIEAFLREGVAFATINYRFLAQTEDGVRSSLEDCKQFLQFIRFYAADFNIDKANIACYGNSAGGGAALWLGVHDEMGDPESEDLIQRESSRIKSVVAIGTQSTYDIVRWEEIFEEYNFSLRDTAYDLQPLLNFYQVRNIDKIYSNKIKKYRKSVDMLGLMDAEDAPIYAENKGKAERPQRTLDFYHHPYHARSLKRQAEKINLEHNIISSRADQLGNIGAVRFVLNHFD
ncbi:MAG: alpha/beta hydrolase [Bacteroidota bacterium]